MIRVNAPEQVQHTDQVAAAAKRKRVIAVVEDMSCSGALYVSCAASEIVIGETAITGSIGVFQSLVDDSELWEKLGVKFILVSSGKFKGAGAPGVKLNAEQIDEVQHRIDTVARHFIAAVAAGRRMGVDKEKDLADWRVWTGREAIACGLADRIGMLEDVLAECQQRTVGLM